MAVYKSKEMTKDGRKYFFRVKYRDIFGVSHDYKSKKYLTLKEAKEEEAKYLIAAAEKKAYTCNVTIDDMFKEYINEKEYVAKRQTILKEYSQYKHLEPIKHIRINDIDLNIYNKLRNYLNGLDFSVAHKNKILRLFKRIILYSNKHYDTSDAIIKFIETFKDVNKIKKEMKFFTYEEYLEFDKVIKDHDYHTFYEILYFLGLRQGELQALTWKDIDFNKKTISITKTLTTKIKGENWTITPPKTKSSITTIPITENVYNDLKIIYDNACKYSDFSEDWFVFGNSEPFKESTIQRRKNAYCKEAGLKQIRIHDFRHSCASMLLNKGASILLVSKWLRHSNITITLNTYAHLYKSELDDMVKILNNI